MFSHPVRSTLSQIRPHVFEAIHSHQPSSCLVSCCCGVTKVPAEKAEAMLRSAAVGGGSAVRSCMIHMKYPLGYLKRPEARALVSQWLWLVCRH